MISYSDEAPFTVLIRETYDCKFFGKIERKQGEPQDVSWRDENISLWLTWSSQNEATSLPLYRG